MFELKDSDFGRLRSFFWPIHRFELRKFLPMLCILFLVCFNYSILRNMKDAIVVTASGAEVIPFIKVWAMLPGAIFLTLLYTRLSTKFSQERAFYIMISLFLVSYGLFAFVLYPLREHIHPMGLTNFLNETLPVGFHGLIQTVCNWSFTLFYVMCELWGSLVMSVIFWGFANEVTKLQEARRFYSVFSIFSNIAAIAAGQAANYFAYHNASFINIPIGSADAWEQTMMFLMLVVIGAGIAMMVIFRWMNKNVLTDPCFDELHRNKRESKKKGKLSIRDSLSFLKSSKYVMCIAVMVLGYNLSINLAEVVWKDRLRVLYPDPVDFNNFLNNLTSSVGVVSTIMALFMSRIIYKHGWTKTALITPVMLLITCVGFFSFMVFQDALGPLALTLTGLSPLLIVVYFGAVQNCFCKAMKYSVFDATKEMAFIPLEHDVKLKGKAAIDGVGSRCGKSGGSLIHQGLILLTGSLTASAPIVAVIIMVAIFGWMSSVRSLGAQFALFGDAESGATPDEGDTEEVLEAQVAG
ncbi:MAG: Npt1/Npt2 family nucleotide transporter [Chlamydiota bacterium]|nr:Npt1/Npt2 family nucleotide transporter [Chlamydiota bacterium]